jgi:hypothetical protein
MCVGLNDGTGKACVLNTGKDACAVKGGDCVFTKATKAGDGTCTGLDDGLGKVCKLNTEGNACAVIGGDCVYAKGKTTPDMF